MTANERDVIERFRALYPGITDIVAFHDLIDRGVARTPFREMTYHIHLTAAAVKLAQEVHRIIEHAGAKRS